MECKKLRLHIFFLTGRAYSQRRRLNLLFQMQENNLNKCHVQMNEVSLLALWETLPLQDLLRDVRRNLALQRRLHPLEERVVPLAESRCCAAALRAQRPRLVRACGAFRDADLLRPLLEAPV